MLLRKGVYPYEYMDSWERFDEASLPDKKVFYCELYLQSVSWYFETLQCFTKFFFHHKGKDERLLLMNISKVASRVAERINT